MYFEILLLTTAVSFLFIFAAIAMIISKKTAVVPLILAGLLLLWAGTLVAYEGMDYKFGEYYVDTQSGNCTTFNVNETLCDINYTSNMTYQYQNLTGNLYTPAEPLNMLVIGYILGGIFFILWGALNAFETPMREEGE